MKLNLPLHPSMRHPLTGEPIRALYIDKHDRPRYQIMGGDDTVPTAEETAAAEKATADKAAADAKAAEDAKAAGPKEGELGYFPTATPRADMTPAQQIAYDAFHGRKHEGRAKEWSAAFPGKTAAEIKAIVDASEAARRNTLTLDEKTIEDAKAEARKSALAEHGPKAVKTAFDLLLGDMPEKDKAEVIDLLDLSKFLNDDNEVDTAKVRTHVARLNPAGKAPHQQRVRDFGAGDRRTDKSSGVKSGRDLYTDRRKSTKTTNDS